MAITHDHAVSNISSQGRSFFARFFDTLVTARSAQLCLERREAEIARLSAKSDQELSAMGLTRAEIGMHVWRDVSFI